MSGCESGWVVFVGSDGFPIVLKPTIYAIKEVVKIFLKSFV